MSPRKGVQSYGAYTPAGQVGSAEHDRAIADERFKQLEQAREAIVRKLQTGLGNLDGAIQSAPAPLNAPPPYGSSFPPAPLPPAPMAPAFPVQMPMPNPANQPPPPPTPNYGAAPGMKPASLPPAPAPAVAPPGPAPTRAPQTAAELRAESLAHKLRALPYLARNMAFISKWPRMCRMPHQPPHRMALSMLVRQLL